MHLNTRQVDLVRIEAADRRDLLDLGDADLAVGLIHNLPSSYAGGEEHLPRACTLAHSVNRLELTAHPRLMQTTFG